MNKRNLVYIKTGELVEIEVLSWPILRSKSVGNIIIRASRDCIYGVVEGDCVVSTSPAFRIGERCNCIWKNSIYYKFIRKI